ncbi:C-terminal binding protein [Virgibacillus sp. W0181]|uniref:C-terminal binding protein n=1 Tax=Virgibacillus sp. W0181 TaxID=3391581 RepID=UPI003F45D2D1
MNKYKVAVIDYEFKTLNIEREVLSQLDIELVSGKCKTDEEIIELAGDADGIINQYALINAQVISQLKNCKIISQYGVGVDVVDLDAATSHNIYVSHVPDYGIEEVSNHAIALLLSWSRKIVQYNNSVREGNWSYRYGAPIHRYSHQTLGVLGFGRIPRSLVRKIKHFGFNILVHDPFVADDDIREAGAEPTDLNILLQESDFVTVHVPLNEQTRYLINKDNLSTMKKNAVIINAARGPIINEDDLVEALQNKQIAGAALDVLENEPVASNNPLLKMENVIITPHSAFYSEESMQEFRTKAAQSVVDALNGKAPKYLVNKDVNSS